jgi:hypothetical protein
LRHGQGGPVRKLIVFKQNVPHLDNCVTLKVPNWVTVTILEVRKQEAGTTFDVQLFSVSFGNFMPHQATKWMEVLEVGKTKSENGVWRAKTRRCPARNVIE